MDYIPKKIKYFRNRSGLSPIELANIIGVDAADIIDYENGRKLPDMDTFIKLSHALDVTTDEILIFQDTPDKYNFFYGKTDE